MFCGFLGGKRVGSSGDFLGGNHDLTQGESSGDFLEEYPGTKFWEILGGKKGESSEEFLGENHDLSQNIQGDFRREFWGVLAGFGGRSSGEKSAEKYGFVPEHTFPIY